MMRAFRMASLVAACVAVGTWLTSTAARAETVGLVVGEQDDHTSVTDSVLDIIEKALAEHGMRTRRVRVGCAVSDDACLKRRLRSAEVERGVRVSVWEETPFRPDPVVSIGLFDPLLSAPYDEVFGEARCGALPCENEVRALLEELLAAWPQRVGTQLLVEGSPEGAAVFERNAVLGVLPLSVRLPRGPHRLRVSAQGYESQEFEVVSGPEEEIRRGVELQPVASSLSGRSRGKRRKRMIVAGSVLLGIGAALVAIGATGFARDGECIAGDPCTAYRERTPASAAYLGLGGASVGAGVGVLVAGRKR